MSDIARRESVMEEAIIGGNLANLSPGERVQYYKRVCESLGLNPLTKPFDYITLNGKLTLYARKDAADQLRSTRGVSIDKPDIQFQDEWIIVTVAARLPDGRTDSDIGCVNRKDMRGDFGNALMKAVTKAKRRVTLSICGLGILDETEVESIPGARVVQVDEPKQLEAPKEAPRFTPAEKCRAAIEMAKTLKDLADAWKAACDDKEAGRLSKVDLDALVPVKDKRKAELSKAPDRNAIFPAMANLAKATGTPFDKLMQDLADEFGVGSLDDVAPEQVQPVLEWLESRMPREKVGAA